MRKVINISNAYDKHQNLPVEYKKCLTVLVQSEIIKKNK
jgi:hypothetical protein